MIPAMISKVKKGTRINDAIEGRRAATIVMSISPAKIFPKSLNENDNILANSETISKSPTKAMMGLEILKNFFKYFTPLYLKP